MTDENIPGPLVEGLRSRGWDVAARESRVLVSTDTDCLTTASDWLDAGRTFRLIYWHQGQHQHVRVGRFLEAFEALAAKPDAFAGCVEYLQVER